METEVVRTGINPILVVVLVLVVAAAAVAVYLLLSKKQNQRKPGGSIPFNQSRSNQPKPSPSSEPVKPKQPVEQPDLESALERRSLLEDQIMILIGGKTGMIEIWRLICYSAEKGDTVSFLNYSSTFPQKVDRLRKNYNELMSIIENKAYLKSANQDIKVTMLTRPYNRKTECEQLFLHGKELEESRLLGRDNITPEELKNWHHQ